MEGIDPMVRHVHRYNLIFQITFNLLLIYPLLLFIIIYRKIIAAVQENTYCLYNVFYTAATIS